MKTETKINTIEELVKYITTHIHDDTRYELTSYCRDVYDNPADGEKWQEEKDQLENKLRSALQPGEYFYSTTENNPEWIAINDRRPPEHTVETWYLEQAWSGYSTHHTNIEISVELGQMIDKIWTRKTGRYSNTPIRTGRLTIPGILKRLGQTDFKVQIDAEKKRQAEISQKNSRNYARRNIKDTSTKLTKTLDEYSKEWRRNFSPEFVSQLDALCNIQEET